MKFGDFVLLMFSMGAISTVLAASNSTSKSDVKTMQVDIEVTIELGDEIVHGTGLEEYQAFLPSALQLINVDDQNRIIGEITIPFNENDQVVKSELFEAIIDLQFNDVAYRYTGIRPMDGFASKKWNVVLYMRGIILGDDNDIYYGYAPQLMPYHKSEAGWPSHKKPDTSTVYYAGPIVIKDVEVKYKTTSSAWQTLFQHKKKPISDKNYLNSDWISNHGIYRLYDTRVYGKSGEDIMHNIYYPVVQHLGSYFT